MTAEPSITGAAGTSVADGVRLIVGRLTRQDPASLRDESKLYADLGLTSAAVLELLMTLEKEYGVDVRPASLEPGHLETVGSLTEYLTKG